VREVENNEKAPDRKWSGAFSACEMLFVVDAAVVVTAARLSEDEVTAAGPFAHVVLPG
jgi:hypothetical protein